MAISAVHYKPAAKRGAKMLSHNHAGHDKYVLNAICQDELKIIDEYTKNRAEFIKWLSAFKTMWDDLQGGIKAAQRRIEPSSPHLRPILLVSYRDKPEMWELEKNEIPKIL